MRHIINLSAYAVLFLSCATAEPLSVPQAGPIITEIVQTDSYPIGTIENEAEVLAQSDKAITAPVTEVKERNNVFGDEIQITWVQNGSGIDLLKVNQSLNDTWQLLNAALIKTEYDIKTVNEQFGKVLVSLPDGIEYIDATDDSFSISNSKKEERFEVEFRVDAVDDGTVISLQFEDDLLLPSDDNLIHLDNVRALMIQE